jgi:hypothetical protein
MATPLREERHSTQETRQESLATTDEKHSLVRFACGSAQAFGKEEWDFVIRFPSVDHPSKRNNGARRGPRLKRWAFFYRPARRDWIRETERIDRCRSRWHQPHNCQRQAIVGHPL